MSTRPRMRCYLDVWRTLMDGGQRTRHRAVAKSLAAAVQEARALSDGWSFTLPITPRILKVASEFVGRERLCCPFLSFTETIPAGASSWSLAIRGPRGTRQFLGKALGLGGRTGSYCATVRLPAGTVNRRRRLAKASGPQPGAARLDAGL